MRWATEYPAPRPSDEDNDCRRSMPLTNQSGDRPPCSPLPEEICSGCWQLAGDAHLYRSSRPALGGASSSPLSMPRVPRPVSSPPAVALPGEPGPCCRRHSCAGVATSPPRPAGRSLPTSCRGRGMVLTSYGISFAASWFLAEPTAGARPPALMTPGAGGGCDRPLVCGWWPTWAEVAPDARRPALAAPEDHWKSERGGRR